MAVYYVPSISPIDYPAFYRAFDGGLPVSFEEWRLVQDTRRRELAPAGHHVVDVHVALADLTGYCRSANRQVDVGALNAVAARIGADLYAPYGSYEVFRSQIVVLEDTRAGPGQTRTGPVMVEGFPARRPWWAFWRRPQTVRPLVVEEAGTGPVMVEAVPARRPWWAFWRRPQRARPLAARMA